MTEQNESGNFSGSEPVELSPGFLIPSKLTFGVRLKIEKHFEKPMTSINWLDAQCVLYLVYYMALELKPELNIEQVEKSLDKVDAIELEQIITSIITKSKAKNLKSEGDLTEKK